MTRLLTPEILDALPHDDPRAVGSRRDLVRINALMGNARYLARALSRRPLARILEIGAGDGASSLRWARRIRPLHRDSSTNVTLLDQHPIEETPIREGFRRIGWTCETVAADVFAFLESSSGHYDAIVANLFVHHFEGDSLKELLRRVAERSDLFVACEPGRSRLGLVGSRALSLVGCNAVTLHDSRVSVLAGFRGRELSEAWSVPGWTLTERPARPFGHLFVAERQG